MKFGTKMHSWVENSNLLGVIRKLMSFSFSVWLFACKDEKVSIKFIICVTPVDRRKENDKSEAFLGSDGFIHEQKLNIQIWLDYIRACTVQSFTL